MPPAGKRTSSSQGQRPANSRDNKRARSTVVASAPAASTAPKPAEPTTPTATKAAAKKPGQKPAGKKATSVAVPARQLSQELEKSPAKNTRSHKANVTPAFVWKEHRAALEKMGYTLCTVREITAKPMRDILIAAGYDPADKIIFDTWCEKVWSLIALFVTSFPFWQMREVVHMDALSAHARTARHQGCKPAEKKDDDACRRHDDGADSTDAEADDVPSVPTKVPSVTSAGGSSLQAMKKDFAAACAYGGLTDTQASWMAVFIRRHILETFPKCKRISASFAQVLKEDLAFVDAVVKRSTGVAIDGTSVRNQIVGVRAVTSDVWVDTFWLEDGTTITSGAMHDILARVAEKFPSARYVLLDRASYNVAGVKGLTEKLEVVWCVGHCLHNAVRCFLQTMPAAYNILLLTKQMMFKATTRAERYLSFQKKLLQAPSAAPHDLLRKKMLSLRDAHVHQLFTTKKAADTLEEYRAELRTHNIPDDIITLSTIQDVIDHLGVEVVEKVNAENLVNSGGTRYTSSYRHVLHVSERQAAIMGFVAEECATFKSKACESARKLLELFNGPREAVDQAWCDIRLMEAALRPVASASDRLCDTSRKSPQIESIKSIFDGLVRSLNDPEQVADDAGVELTESQRSASTGLAKKIEDAYKNHKNHAMFESVQFLHPSVVTLHVEDANLLVDALRSAFPLWWSPAVEEEYKTWALNKHSFAGNARSYWSTLDEADWPSLKPFADLVLSLSCVVTHVDSAFSGMHVFTSNKRRRRLTEQNLSVRAMLFVNKDVKNRFQEGADPESSDESGSTVSL